ncbi:MAG: HipA-like protein, partial [Myxococcota bacterium]
MSNDYPILTVAPDALVGEETMGTKEKFWWKSSNGERWLFKFARDSTGEHWAEKVAAEVCRLLGIPCPQVELSTCNGRPGCSVRSFLPTSSATLVHGNELLERADHQYPTGQLRGVSKHTVSAVRDALSDVGTPVPKEDGL